MARATIASPPTMVEGSSWSSRCGPYRTWIHEHRFEPRAEGTLVTDIVRYAVVGGPLIQRCLVSKDLVRIFDYRQKQLEKIFAEAS